MDGWNMGRCGSWVQCATAEWEKGVLLMVCGIVGWIQ